MSRIPQDEVRPLSYLEVLDEENQALTGSEPSHEDLRLREDYRRALGTGSAESAEPTRKYRDSVMARLHASARSALCFSGGGIRSATFGLGVLQGLAAFSRKPDGRRPGLLGEFDYLSTVSGGGYLGSWFSAWATRRSKIDKHAGVSGEKLRDCEIPDLRDGTAAIIHDLASVPDVAFEPEREPVKHLRAYSNYLSPRLGFFSLDTWTLAAIVLRNMFLNWLVLIPAFAAFLLIPVFCWRVMWVHPPDIASATLWSLIVAGMLLGGQATAYVGFDLPSAGDAERPSKHFLIYCLAPLSLAAVALSVFWAWLPPGSPAAPWWDVVSRGKEGVAWWHFAVFGSVMHGGGMLVGMSHVRLRFHRPPTKTGVVATSAAFVTGFVGGLAGWAVSQLAAVETEYSDFLQDPRLYSCLAFPMLMGVFLFAGTLLVGSTSYVTKDEDREWWATSGGWFLTIALGWLAFASVVLYSPQALDWLDSRISAAVTALTGFMGFAAARAGNSPKTPTGLQDPGNVNNGGGAVRFLKRYGPQVLMASFMLLLVMLLSGLNQRILIMFGFPTGPSLWGFVAPVVWMALAYGALCLMASWFINVNKFSLHAMYRERLIRAYLGASNPCRKPHPFTGFDENDNISMCTLTANKPMHVVNMALNLVHGENLRWQERKAASFTSTRLHTGGLCVDYRSSAFYGGRYGTNKTPISLGTAITISGAAASPNMGYHSSPLLMLVMTLFNARLGWWLGNPRRKRRIWTSPSPRWGIRPFLDEAFGLTTDTNSWIYLSDGGHFENLAIYEMVLRRCHCIVVSDAGCDPDYTYEDLANAVRKIRIDFGIPIDFDNPSMPMSADKLPTPRHSGKHCAIARIRYSAVDGPEAPDGILIYIKPSLNGNEPADVQHYAAADPLFPHQPTSDQFFDESQFESYRRLGLHVIEEILHTPDRSAYEYTLSEFLTAAEAYASNT
ncbi:MAG: patatin-like phospholipase family protein [Acidobacteriia bacterium]|nr:patatin-like phospholipase family protein [Terriglobia bacterium]